jgi:hypothetical protein
MKPAVWLREAITAFAPDDDPRAREVIGRYLADDEDGIAYVVSATNGHCLVAEPRGVETPRPKPLLGAHVIEAGSWWIDLPPDLQLALTRVRIFAGAAVRFAIDRDFHRLILSARSDEGEASEYLDLGAVNCSPELPEGFETCLSAAYVDVVCGCWPVRWYLRPALQQISPATRWNPDPKPYWNDQAQLFCSAGTEARVLIMPMRI